MIQLLSKMLNGDGNKSGRHLSKIVAHIVAVQGVFYLTLHNTLKFIQILENGYNLTLEVSAANLWTYMRMKEKRVKQR